MSTWGHDEIQDLLNRGQFIEIVKFHVNARLDVENVVLEKAPKNCQMISPKIQKQIMNACSRETTKAMMEEMGDGFFAILADESADISNKEQLSICL